MFTLALLFLFVLPFLVSLPRFGQLVNLLKLSSLLKWLLSLSIGLDQLSFMLVFGLLDVAKAKLAQKTALLKFVLLAPAHDVLFQSFRPHPFN